MKFDMTKEGIEKYKQSLLNRLNAIKKECANTAYQYWITDDPSINPAYSYYFRSNWNCSVGENIDTSVSPQNRSANIGQYISNIDPWKAESKFENVSVGQKIHVTNSVSYATDLNYGGGKINYPRPTHYLERGYAFVKNNFDNIVREVVSNFE